MHGNDVHQNGHNVNLIRLQQGAWRWLWDAMGSGAMLTIVPCFGRGAKTFTWKKRVKNRHMPWATLKRFTSSKPRSWMITGLRWRAAVDRKMPMKSTFQETFHTWD